MDMTQRLKAYHLRFLTPVHPGIESIGQEKTEETIRSDTLWGALIQCWLLLFDDNCNDLVADPIFKISSCFPLIDENRFFPVPLGAFDGAMEEASRKPPGFVPSVKDLKKVRYISESLFKDVLEGNNITLEKLIEEQVYPSFEGETSRFLLTSQRPRIRTDQLTGGVYEDAFFTAPTIFLEKTQGYTSLLHLKTTEQGTSLRRPLDSWVTLG